MIIGKKLKRDYEIEHVKIHIDIGEGVAILTTNQPMITRQMYNMATKDGKMVYWEARQNAMVEKFESLTAEMIAERLDKDFKTALDEKAKARSYAIEEAKKKDA